MVNTKTKKLLLTCLLTFALCSFFTAKTFGQQGGTLRVDSTADNGGDGSSWTAAYNTLWAALEFVNPLDGNWEIWVAQGTYTPVLFDSPFIINGKTGGSNDRIVLLGGFAGLAVPANPDQRDPKLYPTILSGDIGNNDGPFTGESDVLSDSNRSDNARNILLVTDSGRGNRIEGFTIEGGIGGGEILFNQPLNIGGGMIIKDSAIDYRQLHLPFQRRGAIAA